ncbi:DUF5984 family protein [Nocardia sp. NPDC050710]|uniref:DUF5984 family protein n=1 Tax=Nocardia sp. NPDC050710 TaxID=3157220 RepID=UPI0033C6E401
MGLHRAVRFQFELVPVEEVVPWGTDRNLHWFGLTEGWYCLDVGGVDLLRYTEQTTARHPLEGERAAPPWADYYVARLWEDMLQALPYILEPVPDDLVDIVATGWSIEWDDTIDNAEFLNNTLIDAALDVCDHRHVDTGYLRFGPGLRWWRTVESMDTVSVDWRFAVDPDGEVAFTAPLSGRASVSTDEFIAAVTDFDHQLFQAMQVRVDRIAATGAPARINLDVPGLIREQAARRTWLSQSLAQQVNTDWDAVRAGVSILAPYSR